MVRILTYFYIVQWVCAMGFTVCRHMSKEKLHALNKIYSSETHFLNTNSCIFIIYLM